MNHLLFSRPFKKGFQVLLLLAILLFNFGASVVYAAPSNDNFANATLVTVIAYTDTVDTSTATVEANDPDNIGSPGLCDGNTLEQGYKSVWYKYTASTKGIIAADTFGTDPISPTLSYDT